MIYKDYRGELEGEKGEQTFITAFKRGSQISGIKLTFNILMLFLSYLSLKLFTLMTLD